MALLSEIVGFAGVFEVLGALEKAPGKGIPEEALYERAAGQEGPDSAESVIENLSSAALIRKDGHHFRLTPFGSRTFFLLEALNGGDVTRAFERLSQLQGGAPRYELVRQGMNLMFFRSLVARPGFRRLFICSPWINMSREATGCLTHAVHQIERRHGTGPELFVITRPARGGGQVPPDTVAPLVALGADVYLHPRLHSKLYLREPGPSGGVATAIVGSQNLTFSNNLELGIKINGDTHMINQLIRYFWDVSGYCIEP